MGCAGLVLGMISMLCCTILLIVFPFLILAAPVCAGVGLTLSWVAYRDTRMLDTGANNIPKVALAVNIGAVLGCIFWIILRIQEGAFS